MPAPAAEQPAVEMSADQNVNQSMDVEVDDSGTSGPDATASSAAAPAASGPVNSIAEQARSPAEAQTQEVALAVALAQRASTSSSGGGEGGGPSEPVDPDENDNNNKSTGWLVTSCDVGTTEPQSLSQELERLQVLKSYHIMDRERDESFDRLTTMASRVLGTPFTFLSLVDMGRIWFRCNPESDCEEQLTRDILSCISRVILKHSGVFVIPDTNQDDMFRQQQQQSQQQGENVNSTVRGASESTDSSSNSNTSNNLSAVQFRFFAGAPLLSPEGYRLGAFCMLGTDPKPHGATELERENLRDFAALAVKSMVDRRKLTTQGNPSHLVACTAHDLITPLTGIQLSLSLLQQDGEFQAKLGEKRRELITAAVRSSNMMLRICQSTIETLRGNRKIPAGTDWSLPRNLMQIAEASPFIDMKEFASNLEAISSSIPKRVPLGITLHPSAPTNIVSDGLKIFRSALNLLSNACSRTDPGFISMTIYDDQDGSLVFECEDTGKDVASQDSQVLFSQDSDPSNFGLYSVAYQISWLGGKYGVRVRDHSPMDSPVGADSDSDADADAATLPAGANMNRGNSATSDKTPGTGTSDTIAGPIFWFSIPIVLPQDVSELMGLAKSLSDGNEMTGIPTFRADLPSTPPASPLVQDYQYNDNDNSHESEPGIPKGEILKQPPGGNTRTLKALVIEDSTTVRKILARALSKLGYQVYEAVDGMEGLRELKATMFDMVLCDFLMPVMDGLDCVKQYREWEEANRQIFRQYIVGISAHASRNDIERGLSLGMDDFKPKPIMLKTLTGLHESQAIGEVRSNLDNLLNFPSFDIVSLGGVEPKSKSVVFDFPAASGDRMSSPEIKSPPLFATVKNSSSSGETMQEKRKLALFSISTNLSSQSDPKTTGALFSIPAGLREKEGMVKNAASFAAERNPTSEGKEDNVAREPSSLFPIPTPAASWGGESKKPALFSIATNLSPKADDRPIGTSNPGALFSLNNASSQRAGKTDEMQRSTALRRNDQQMISPGANHKPSLLVTSWTAGEPAAPNGENTQQKLKRAALFDVSHQSGASPGDNTSSSRGKDKSIPPSEGKDGERRATKAMKRTARVDIATSDQKK